MVTNSGSTNNDYFHFRCGMHKTLTVSDSGVGTVGDHEHVEKLVQVTSQSEI